MIAMFTDVYPFIVNCLRSNITNPSLQNKWVEYTALDPGDIARDHSRTCSSAWQLQLLSFLSLQEKIYLASMSVLNTGLC